LVEIGSSLGHGTKVLSKLFKKVIAVDVSPEKHDYAREYLGEVDNVEFKLMDVYGQRWDFEEKDSIVFIDCVHDYQHLKSDIDNAMSTFDKPIIMFDDYGLFPDLKQLIDEYVQQGKLKILKKIGEHPGKFYPKTQNKILKDSEGLICQSL
jgi:SAM-dependent methyltransferase